MTAAVKIDWQSLYGAFQSSLPDVCCFLSRQTGEVVRLKPGDPRLDELAARRDTWVAVGGVPPRIQFQWLTGFIASVEDELLRAQMRSAADGRGAFRRFKDILAAQPDERRKWFEYRDERVRERVVLWVEEQGIQAGNPPAWGSERDITEMLHQRLREWFAGTGAPMPDDAAIQSLSALLREHFEWTPVATVVRFEAQERPALADVP